MLGRIQNKIDPYYLKIGSFYAIILFTIFLCVFHKAFFAFIILLPAILLITNKYKNNKYFRETDLLVAMIAITFAFMMEFIITHFSEYTVLICILISFIILIILSGIIASLSFLFAFMTRSFFHYLKID